jgi:hypothetical protein
VVDGEKLKALSCKMWRPVVIMASSFLTFFHSLLSEGIIPEKEDFHVFVTYYNSYGIQGSGKYINISNKTYTNSIFNYLEDVTLMECSKVKLSSMYYEYIMEYHGGEWQLTKEWYRPNY